MDDLVRVLMLTLSLWGHYKIFSRFLKFRIHGSWYVVMISIGFFMYLGAMLDQMLLVSQIIFWMGLLFFAIDLLKKPRRDISFPQLMVAFILVMTCAVLWNTRLEHYDNFSHWAKIVKFLFLENRLPNGSDAIIEFTSYPPGSAVFIYHIVRVLGFSEGKMLIGQFLLIIASILGMFTYVRDRKHLLPQIIMFAFVGMSFAYSHSIGLNNLLVDYVMVALAAALIPVMIGNKTNFWRLTYIVFVGVFYIISFKNSAIFFTIPALIVYLYLLFKYHLRFFKIIGGTAISLASLSSFVLWSQHTSRVFTDVSKHGVDASSYKAIYAQKSAQDIENIKNLFIKMSLNLSTEATVALLISGLSMLLLLIMVVRFRRKYTPKLILFVVSMIALVLIYYTGIYIMFLISMPLEEALVLAGYERYAMSMGVYVLFMVGYFIMIFGDILHYEIDVTKRNFRSYSSLTVKRNLQLATLLLGFAVILFFFSENNLLIKANEDYKRSVPHMVTQAIDDKTMDPNLKYLVVTSNDEGQIDSYYIHNIAQYYLWTKDVVIRDLYYTMSVDEFKVLVEGIDVIVVVERNLSFDDMYQEAFGRILTIGIHEIN